MELVQKMGGNDSRMDQPQTDTSHMQECLPALGRAISEFVI